MTRMVRCGVARSVGCLGVANVVRYGVARSVGWLDVARMVECLGVAMIGGHLGENVYSVQLVNGGGTTSLVEKGWGGEREEERRGLSVICSVITKSSGSVKLQSWDLL